MYNLRVVETAETVMSHIGVTQSALSVEAIRLSRIRVFLL